MRLSQLQQPMRAAAYSLLRPTWGTTLLQATARLRIDNSVSNTLANGQRWASVKAQGAYKTKPKRTIPKKLGAKRTGDQFVIPGNILYKQRGTHWWPGENCIMGRDHTIHSMATGYVKYYRDPARHPDRKYIGVVFNKSDVLPYHSHAERKRRLGMTAHTIVQRAPEPDISASGIPNTIVSPGKIGADGKPRGPNRLLRLRHDYSYREDNWRIGRLVKLAGVTKSKGGVGHSQSRSARFRSKRWKRETQLAADRKARESREGEGVEELDEWTLAAQKRQQEERNKKLNAEKDKKKQKADKVAKQRAAGIKRAMQQKKQ